MHKLITTELLKNLNLARFEIQLRPKGDAVLPPFLGSTLRGAFGHALKAIACSMPHGDCSRCLLIERCLYPRLFETSAGDSSTSALLKGRQDAPRPFIFIPPQPAGDNSFLRARDDLLRTRVRVKVEEPVVFGLSLFGDAIQEVSYVVYAISLMAQHGFGAARAPFALERVFALDAQGERKLIYESRSNRIELQESCYTTLGALVQGRLDQLLSQNLATSQELTLRFMTPTRLRIKGQLLETPSFAQLITTLSLRLSLLAQTLCVRPLVYDHRSMIEMAQRVKTRMSTLRLMALDRFSNRRRGKLELDGFMGEITFDPPLHELLPMLVAGEFLHIGSGTAFGLGRYRIG
jgi:hypothetical protein